MAYGAVFDASHFAIITLRLFRVKPVPGPNTTLIFLPACRTVRQMTICLYDGVGRGGRIDHGLLSTETSWVGVVARATTRHVPVVSDMTATRRALKGPLPAPASPAIHRSFGETTNVVNRARTLTWRLGGSRLNTRPFDP